MRVIKAPSFFIITALSLFLYTYCISDPKDTGSKDEPADSGSPHSTKVNPGESYQVSSEIYKKTFQDIKDIIEELNLVIQRKDYKAWLSYLTKKYIVETSKPDYLLKWREDKLLKQKNIVLNNLLDYFNYLVVPRRANAQLDLLEFLDDSHLYAYTIINGEKYLLYYLIKTDKGWKIDFY